MTAPVTDRAGLVRVMRGAAWHWRASSQGEDILAAIEAAGLRVVPVEAPVDMLAAGTEDWLTVRAMEDRAEAVWRAMLAASPFAPQETPDAG